MNLSDSRSPGSGGPIQVEEFHEVRGQQMIQQPQQYGVYLLWLWWGQHGNSIALVGFGPGLVSIGNS